MRGLKLRNSEWVMVGFFAYIAAITPFFAGRPGLGWQPLLELGCVVGLLMALAYGAKTRLARAVDFARDWAPLLLTLAAFREMELFLPARFPHLYESVWNRWDHYLLSEMGLRGVIEAWGVVIPASLELSYVLVYGVGFFCVAVLYLVHTRPSVDAFLSIYLMGTLGAYALFPYFPSQPPRYLYPHEDLPQLVTTFRRLNLLILKEGTIHSSVFPSAHVSAAFTCAWAMFLCLPTRKRYGWGLLLYALCVSVATVYGRYHYGADVAAGIAVSLVAGLLGYWFRTFLLRPAMQRGPLLRSGDSLL